MNVLSELERWRERQLDEYRHSQIIDRMDQQRLLDEYRRAQAIERMDEQNAGACRGSVPSWPALAGALASSRVTSPDSSP